MGLAALALIGTGALLLRLDAEPQGSRTTSQTDRIRFLLDGSYGARFAGELCASRERYFSPRIELASQADTLDFVQTVARQHAIGVTTGQEFLLASWRGVPVTAFAASFLDTPTAIFTLESSGLRRPVDLVGKRLGYRRGSEGEVIFDAMMAQLGLPRSQIVKIAGLDSFDALRAGDVDAIIAAVGEQPDPAKLGPMKLHIIRPQDYGIHVPGQVYFASNDLIRDHPSIIAEVVEGLIRGWQFAYSDYARSVPVLVDADPQSLKSERLKFELDHQRGLVLPIGGRIAEYDESRWRTLRDILLFSKLGEEEVPTARVVSYQFIRDVYRRSPQLGGPAAWSGEK